jgi:hypothetical protein
MDMTEMAKIQPRKLKSKSKLCVTPLLKVDGRNPQNREKNAPARRFRCML